MKVDVKVQQLEILHQGSASSKLVLESWNKDTQDDDFIWPVFLASVNDFDMAEKGKQIGAKCELERREAEAQRIAGTETTNMLKHMVVSHSFGDD